MKREVALILVLIMAIGYVSANYCVDSDVTAEYPDGINSYVEGNITFNASIFGRDDIESWPDQTMGSYDPAIEEVYCGAGGMPEQITIKCPYGKLRGAKVCLSLDPSKKCTDSDGGKDYYVNGAIRGYNQWAEELQTKDYCVNNPDDKKTLMEAYCDGYMVKFENYTCPGECSEGACVNASPVQCDNFKKKCADGSFVGKNPAKGCAFFDCPSSPGNASMNSTNITVPVNITQNASTGCEFCSFEGKCYGLGKRVKDKFCSESKELISRAGIGNQCKNSYECQSYLCKNGKCENMGLWRKIIEGFKTLFGKKQ